VRGSFVSATELLLAVSRLPTLTPITNITDGVTVAEHINGTDFGYNLQS